MMRILLSAVLLVFYSGASLAGDNKPLTTDQAKRFVETLPTLEAFGEELEEEGKTEVVRVDAQPKADEEFKPYSKVVMALKEHHPADYQTLDNKLKPHGFKADEWGRVGDRVLVAWMALRMAEEDPKAMAMMEDMDQSMIDMMPPEMQANIRRAFVMMETVKNAPEEDKKAVAPVKDDLDAYMESQDQS